MAITHGNVVTKSPRYPVISALAGNVITLMANVAVNIGKNSSFMLAHAASILDMPRPSLSIYPSMVMMESSTIIPRTTMSAASETVLRSIPAMNITARATAVHTGTPELAIRADFIGKSISITRMTTSMEITRSLRNERTDTPTTFGWSVILLRFTLSGSPFSNSSRTASTSRPNATILLSGRISTDRMRAVFPL